MNLIPDERVYSVAHRETPYEVVFNCHIRCTRFEVTPTYSVPLRLLERM